MYYLEDSFLEAESELNSFFNSNKPTEEMARRLQSSYYHYLLNDDGDEVGLETLSPLIIAIILKKESHFLILLSLFIQNAEHMIVEQNRLDSIMDSNLYHLKQCAIEINHQPFIDILLALDSPIFDRAAFREQLISIQHPGMTIDSSSKSKSSWSDLTATNGLFRQNTTTHPASKSQRLPSPSSENNLT